MQASAKTFLWISLAAHVAVGVAVHGRASPAPASQAPEPRAEALFSGDTFEVPEQIPAAAEPAPAEAPDRAAIVDGSRTASLANDRPRAPRVVSRAGSGESTAGTAFGASGDRASVDLATAFTRGFPQAASADPAWAAAPYGPAGEATVVLEIDASGALVSSRVEGSPGPALRAGITRTVALIGARAFTASRPVTRLHVTASVSADQIHDGLHGEVFAIGGSFAKAEGSAFFALAIGRRVDLRVKE
jgi:hypothetical protein